MAMLFSFVIPLPLHLQYLLQQCTGLGKPVKPKPVQKCQKLVIVSTVIRETKNMLIVIVNSSWILVNHQLGMFKCCWPD